MFWPCLCLYTNFYILKRKIFSRWWNFALFSRHFAGIHLRSQGLINNLHGLISRLLGNCFEIYCSFGNIIWKKLYFSLCYVWHKWLIKAIKKIQFNHPAFWDFLISKIFTGIHFHVSTSLEVKKGTCFAVLAKNS